MVRICLKSLQCNLFLNCINASWEGELFKNIQLSLKNCGLCTAEIYLQPSFQPLPNLDWCLSLLFWNHNKILWHNYIKKLKLLGQCDMKRGVSPLLICYINPLRGMYYQNTVCPFSTSDLSKFKFKIKTNGIFQIHILKLCRLSWIGLVWIQRRQLEWGRTTVQAAWPSSVGLSVGECTHHMHSNSSIRCLVFPDRICLRVLYLSRPAFMFSAWIMSFTVFLLSSRALANSELKACKHGPHDNNVTIQLWGLFFFVCVRNAETCTYQ